MNPIARLIASATAAALLVAGSPSLSVAGDQPTKPDLNDPALIARGKAVYADNCASCHGPNLEGQPDWRKRLPNGRLAAPPHDANGHTWHHTDKQLFDMIKNGTAGMMPGYETDMPAYKDKLSDADIWAVLWFIESTWPAHIRERQQHLSQQKPYGFPAGYSNPGTPAWPGVDHLKISLYVQFVRCRAVPRETAECPSSPITRSPI
jgi:mono/diheme cytochrome c family protein